MTVAMGGLRNFPGPMPFKIHSGLSRLLSLLQALRSENMLASGSLPPEPPWKYDKSTTKNPIKAIVVCQMLKRVLPQLNVRYSTVQVSKVRSLLQGCIVCVGTPCFCSLVPGMDPMLAAQVNSGYVSIDAYHLPLFQRGR